MSEFDPEGSGTKIYEWMIYLSFVFFLASCIIKYLQIDLYAR